MGDKKENGVPVNNIKNETESPKSENSSPNKGLTQSWVKFEEEEAANNKHEAAIIPTENVQVNLERSFSKTPTDNVAVLDPKPLRNVELPIATVEPIRQGFSNGDVIVSLLPTNTKFPWITPAKFRPELVPEELMAQGLTLTVEEYVQAMELLVNDFRFTIYNICYKRILLLWITVSFLVLFAVLFSGEKGYPLFALGLGWLIFNAAAIFMSMWMKFKLTRNLEQCLAHVNKQLLRHKIVLALDDRGKISCHKVTLCFLYMDSGPCISHLQSNIDQHERDHPDGWEQKMDITSNDIIIQGSRTTRLSRKQGLAELLYLRYIQRWGKDFLRRRLDWTLDEMVGNPSRPRHINSALCPCQYVEDIIINNSNLSSGGDCCPAWSRFLHWQGLD